MRRLLRIAAWSAAALAVGVASSTPRGRAADRAVFAALNGERSPSADRVFGSITELGALGASAAAAAVLAMAGHRRAAIRGAVAAGGAWLAGQGLKKVWMRPRPYDADPDGTRLLIGRPIATSWPSSHPAVLTAFCVAAGRELDLGSAARAGLAGLAVAVGVSRSHLGVHYPSDVVGGFLLGRAVAEGVSPGD